MNCIPTHMELECTGIPYIEIEWSVFSSWCYVPKRVYLAGMSDGVSDRLISIVGIDRSASKFKITATRDADNTVSDDQSMHLQDVI